MSHERILGIDCIKTFLFLCIYLFHMHDFFYALDPSSFFHSPPIFWQLGELVARLGAFAGFATLALTFFLFGMKRSLPSFWFILVILPCFWLVFCAITALKDLNTPSLIWDIYPLIFVSFLAIAFIELFSLPTLEAFFAILSAILLIFPPRELSFLSPGFMKEMLIGLCPIDYADWPLLPWIGLSYLGYYVGKFAKKHARRLAKAYCWEYGVGFFILVNLYLHRKAYFATPLNMSWACYNFHRQADDFWAHLLFWALLVRLSLLAKVQQALAGSLWCRWPSKLAINQSFYLAYFLHYIVLFSLLGILRSHELASNACALNATLFFGPILTEGLSRKMQVFISWMRRNLGGGPIDFFFKPTPF